MKKVAAKRSGPISLNPLSFDEALSDLLRVKPPERKRGAKKPRRTVKKKP
jgi:hypothetical protein